jgi:uncharacterized membrane protein
MMLQLRKTQQIILWLVILLPVAHALYIYPRLPEQVPVHFTNGQADRYADKSFFYFMVGPLTNLAFHYLFRYLAQFDLQKKIVDRFSFFLLRLVLAGSISLVALSTNNLSKDPETEMSLLESVNLTLSSLSLVLHLFAYFIACIAPLGINLSLSEKMRQPDVWEKVRRDMLKILPVSVIITLFLIWILPEDAVPIFVIISTPCILLLPLLYAYYITGEAYDLKR